MSDLVERSVVLKTLRHYLYYGGEDGFMNAIKEIERLPSEERPNGTEFRFGDTRVEDGIEYFKMNTDNQFDPTLRRHYDLNIYSLDYDENDREKGELIFSKLVHMSREELEQLTTQIVEAHARKHHAIYAEAVPKGFQIMSASKVSDTSIGKHGQIGFDL